jgi:hypothetical protein
MKEISKSVFSYYMSLLEEHPVYSAVENVRDLRIFMQHHVYSVWDFMSLVKYLQSVVAPVRYPWFPVGDSSLARFVNELVLEEESDECGNTSGFSSHYELYIKAMNEIGADTSRIEGFVKRAYDDGVDWALDECKMPAPSRKFTKHTFECIKRGEPHEVAAFLALGREHIIPSMFKALLNNMNVSTKEAPTFHNYLERHIELDGDSHGPLSLRLLNSLCCGEEYKVKQALKAADEAIRHRLELFNGILASINYSKKFSGVDAA